MLDNILLITDLDGTLLDENKQVSAENLAAIKELEAAGGKFTVATGRGHAMMLPIVEQLDLKMPVVLFNGGAIYDFAADKFIWKSAVSGNVRDYLKTVLTDFPNLAAEVLVGKDVYVPRLNPVEEHHLSLGNVEAIFCDIDDIPNEDEWIKVLFADYAENIPTLMAYANEHPFDGGEFVRTAPVFFELIPKGTNKGTGLKILQELTGNSRMKTAAVGDYDNDIDMIKIADYGFAVENAPDNVKDIADIVVTNHKNHAIAHIVDLFKKGL